MNYGFSLVSVFCHEISKNMKSNVDYHPNGKFPQMFTFDSWISGFGSLSGAMGLHKTKLMVTLPNFTQ